MLNQNIEIVAEDPSNGINVKELMEFAQAAEQATTRGDIGPEHSVKVRIGFKSQIQKMKIAPPESAQKSYTLS
jgi:hypothetical protein